MSSTIFHKLISLLLGVMLVISGCRKEEQSLPQFDHLSEAVVHFLAEGDDASVNSLLAEATEPELIVTIEAVGARFTRQSAEMWMFTEAMLAELGSRYVEECEPTTYSLTSPVLGTFQIPPPAPDCQEFIFLKVEPLPLRGPVAIQRLLTAVKVRVGYWTEAQIWVSFPDALAIADAMLGRPPFTAVDYSNLADDTLTGCRMVPQWIRQWVGNHIPTAQ